VNVIRRWFSLDRHDVRSTLPAAIQAIMQNGLLYRAFEDSLIPNFLFPGIATTRPWQGNLGDTTTFTRAGLLTPTTTPITGSDPSAATYTVEQYSATMDQYGNAMDTNLLQSAMSIASKFIEDTQKLGINAGQSLNQLARKKLYAAYAGGNTWATATSSSSTALQVADSTGFSTVLVNGVPTAVSGTHPLTVTVNGVANTVTAVPDSTHLTLGSAISAVVGWAVVSAVAPVTYRPSARANRFALTSGDVANLAVFRSAVARLLTQNVPTVAGNYVAHVDPTTEAELFADTDFKQAYQGRGDSTVFGDMSIGTFVGIDWVRNTEAPTTADGGSGANLAVHQPIVCGAGALVQAPFARLGDLLAEVNGPTGAIEVISPADGVQVAHIIRPPQDRLQQIVGSAWSFIGDYSVPSDATTGDASLYKRAVLIEHV
jgi:hypothetical protein